MASHFCWSAEELRIQLRISPRASRDQVGSLMGERLKIAITAPPVDGKANQHLQQFLAKQFGVSRSQVSIESGLSHRDKTVCIRNPTRLPQPFLITKPS
ncbi:MAG: YggU family protein [Planctomycetaceae bacterium]|nr:YggU family protein [Planctomycetaceae bacterium]